MAASTPIPPVTHPRWRELVTGKLTVKLDFLATKILLTRLATKAKDMAGVDGSCAELQALFAKNAHLPQVQGDLQKIFG